MSGRAKLGLQASSRFSKRIRRLNLGRWLVVFVVVEELVDVEAVVSDAVVVEIQIIILKIEGVGDIEDPSLKEIII
jgi:hypothetical protein